MNDNVYCPFFQPQMNVYCQFSGGGDLLIITNMHSCVVVQDKIEDGGMSPDCSTTSGSRSEERGF